MVTPHQSKDLFLSYHTPDRESVVAVRNLLEKEGISTFLDKNNLTVGKPWPQELEKAIKSVQAVAVFLGKDGLGMWMKREIGLALDRQAQSERDDELFPVIPILLPGADPTEGFLGLNTWVDLREEGEQQQKEAIQAIVNVVKGHPASESIKAQVRVINPYRGLKAFKEEHAGLFFGRETFTQQLLEKTLTRSLVAVIGPSGSGKSSVVQAGLVPQLRRQHAPDPTWDTVVFQPGAKPFHALARELMPLVSPKLSELDLLRESQKLGQDLETGTITLEAVVEKILSRIEEDKSPTGGTIERKVGADRLLLVIDQFEELFTHALEADRKAFLAKLLTVIDRVPMTMVLTLRADFLPKAIESSRILSDRLQENSVYLGRMMPEELRRAIVEPARKVGLSYENSLPDIMLQEVGEEPGNLALLEFALTELYTNTPKESSLLTHETFASIGRVGGAISSYAEKVFNKLSHNQQAGAEQVFKRLIYLSNEEGNQHSTRRRAAKTEFSDEEWEVVKILADARLLVISDDEGMSAVTAEVSHEVLLREWSRLANWIQKDRKFLLWVQDLRSAEDGWRKSGQDSEALLRGKLLTKAKEWMERRSEDLTELEIQFIQESENKRKRDKKNQIAVGVVIGIVLVALVLVAIAKWFEAKNNLVEARDAKEDALAQEQTLKTLTDAWVTIKEDPVTSGLILRELKQKDNEHLWLASDLARRLVDTPMPTNVFSGHQDDIIDMARVTADKNGRPRVVTGSWDGTVRLWTVCQREENSPCPEPHILLDLKKDNPTNAKITKISVRKDGKWVVVGTETGLVEMVSIDGKNKCKLGSHGYKVNNLLFSASENRVLSGAEGGKVNVYIFRDCDNVQQPFATLGEGIEPEKLSAATFMREDGKKIVTGSSDGVLQVWDISESPPRQTRIGKHDGTVTALAVQRNDRVHVVSGDENGNLLLWKFFDSYYPSKAHRREFGQEGKHGEKIVTVVFSRDGKKIITGSHDGSVRMWNLSSPRKPLASWKHQSKVTRAEFSERGSRVVTSSLDGTAMIVSLTGNGSRLLLRGHRRGVTAAVFLGQEGGVATSSLDRMVGIWNMEDTEGPKSPISPNREFKKAAFSQIGNWVARGFADGTVELSKLGENSNLSEFSQSISLGKPVSHLLFNSDGTLLVTGSYDNGFSNIQVWRVGNGSQGVRPYDMEGPKLSSPINVMTFGDTDELSGVSRLAGGHDNGLMWVWDLSAKSGGPQKKYRILEEAHKGTITNIIILPYQEHKRLVSSDSDGQVVAWVGPVFSPEKVTLEGMTSIKKIGSFPDGTKLIIQDTYGTVSNWSIQDSIQSFPAFSSGGHKEMWISPKRNWLAMADYYGSTQVKDLGTDRSQGMLFGHKKEVVTVVFSQDEKLMATSSWDKTVRLWDLTKFGTALVVLELSDYTEVENMWLSANGEKVVTIDETGQIHEYIVGWKFLAKKLKNSIRECLTAEQRTRYLGEDAEDASKNAELCQNELI